jgi:hypothetical protein
LGIGVIGPTAASAAVGVEATGKIHGCRFDEDATAGATAGTTARLTTACIGAGSATAAATVGQDIAGQSQSASHSDLDGTAAAASKTTWRTATTTAAAAPRAPCFKAAFTGCQRGVATGAALGSQGSAIIAV